MSYRVRIEQDEDFTYVEVREDGHRVAYYSIEHEYAKPIATALLALGEGPGEYESDEEPTGSGEYETEHPWMGDE